MQPRHFKTYVNRVCIHVCVILTRTIHMHMHMHMHLHLHLHMHSQAYAHTHTHGYIYIYIYILFITVDITEYYRVTIKFELGKYSVTLSWGQSRMNRAGEIQLYAKLGTINCLDIIHRHSKRLVACIVKLTDLWAFDGVLSLSSMDWEDPRINEMRDNDFGLVIWGIVIRIVHYGHWNAIF